MNDTTVETQFTSENRRKESYLLWIFQVHFLIYYCFFCSALIADNTGSYIYSFYMTGGVLFAACLIPVIIIFINWRKSKVHPQTSEVEEQEEEEVIDTISMEVRTYRAQCFGLEPRDEILSRMRSSTTNT